MSPGVNLTPELLSAQGRALRALALSLLRDPHAADDVVQDTWLACLSRPAEIRGRLSGWLAAVARNLALRRRRGEARRRSREEHAAALERTESAAQAAILREEALRAVTQALLALEEPYKSALILRYYDERSPLEIARELGLPPTTVKSRIERGLERLRRKLPAEYGGDEERALRGLALISGGKVAAAALGGGVAAGSIAGPLTTGIGALVMGLKLELVGAALLVACGVYFLWPAGEREELVSGGSSPSASATAQRSPPPAPAGELVAAVSATPADSSREPVVSAAQEEPAPAPAFEPEASFPYRIAGFVRDERDQPLPGAHVYLGPHSFPLNRAGETDEEGRFSVEFRGRKPALDLILSIQAGSERFLGLRELRAVSGQDLELDLALRGHPSKTVFVSGSTWSLTASRVFVEGDLRGVDFHEDSGDDEEAAAPEGTPETPATAVVHDFEDANIAPLERAGDLEHAESGRGIFVDRPLDRACQRELGFLVQALYERDLTQRLDALRFAGILGERLELQLSPQVLLADGAYQIVFGGLDLSEPGEAPPPPAIVRGIVRDAWGEPVAGAEVGWGLGARPPTTTTTTDETGAFELTDLPLETEVVLRAGGGDLGLARGRFTLRAGEELAWNPLLERGDEVLGRILDPAREPIPGALVELWSADPSAVWSDSTSTDAEGRFAIPNVPRGSFDLLVIPQGRPAAFPVRIVRRVRPGEDLGDLVLTKGELATGSLSIALEDELGQPVIGPEARLWHEDSGRGLFAREPDEEGVLSLGVLPAGRYRVEAGCELGWRDLGTVWIEPGEDLDLGRERFDPPAFVSLEVPPELSDVRASLWSAHPDVFARTLAIEQAGATVRLLRRGSYVWTASSAKLGRARAEIDVLAGSPQGRRLREDEGGALAIVQAEPFQLPPGEPASAASCQACHGGLAGAGGAR